MDLIELENITFAYAQEKSPVLQDFSLAVPQGICLAVMGDNGSGKTTLFRILNGLSFPQSGTYAFDGIEITQKFLKNNRNAKKFHKRIGYLFQNPDVMLFNATVYDEIAFGPRQMGLSDHETDTRVQDCLRLFGLENLRDKAPYHLSGGQKKKAAMAAILALDPEVLVLDEPYAGLDRKSQRQLTELLAELKKAGKTVILAVHDKTLAGALADRIVFLDDGYDDCF